MGVPEKDTDWLEVRIDVHAMAHEPLCAFLFDMQCTGIVTEEPSAGRLTAYFSAASPPEMIQKALITFFRDLEDTLPGSIDPKMSIRRIEDQDWGLAWRRFFHADRVTPSLMIVPAWEDPPGDFPAHVIRIDPGPAFGTGLHPTTRMCLQGLDEVRPGAAWRLLDVGTGSGILAIYGAKLGATPVLAVDIDTEALAWAAHNIELNGLSGFIDLSSAPVAALESEFHVVTANLVRREIDALMDDLVRLTAPGGRLILSGLLVHQVTETADRLSGRAMRIEKVLSQAEWSAVIAGREDKAA